MTDLAITIPGKPLPMPAPAPSAQAPTPAARTKAERRRVTGKLKHALDAMIYEGQPFDEAARTAGLHVRSMRRALERPYVQTYLRTQKQVFRASVSAANIFALRDLRDKSGNAMAQLGAIKTLEQLDDDQQPGAAAPQRAGMVIVVLRESAAADAKPLIELSAQPPSEA